MNEYLQVTDILLIFAATKFQVRHERGSRRNERLFLCPFKKKGELRLSSKYDCTAWGSGQRPQRYSHLEALSARSAVF